MNITKYLKETQAELKEVSWPTKEQTITYTVMVIIISVLVAVFLGGIDFGLKELLTFILK